MVSATHSPVADDVVTAIQALGAQLAAAAATLPHQESSEPGPEIAYWCRAVHEDVERLPLEHSVSTDSLRGLASRVSAIAEAMQFDFLYDRRRRIFSVGYRLADAEGPG